MGRRLWQGAAVDGRTKCHPSPDNVTGASHARAQIPMTFLETLAWGLGLFAFARLVLAPLGDYLSRRYVAADSWSATE